MALPAPIAASLRLIVLLTASHAGFVGGRLAISLQALHLQASALTVGLLMSLMMVLAFGAFGAALDMLPMFWIAALLLGAGGGYAAGRQRRR